MGSCFWALILSIWVVIEVYALEVLVVDVIHVGVRRDPFLTFFTSSFNLLTTASVIIVLVSVTTCTVTVVIFVIVIVEATLFLMFEGIGQSHRILDIVIVKFIDVDWHHVIVIIIVNYTFSDCSSCCH
jgi:hypothetical protein